MKKKSLINTLIESHGFFVRESASFMQGTSRLKYYLVYPRAYLRFMTMMASDWKNNQKTIL